MESKHNTGTSPSDSKYPAQENVANKSTILTEPSDSSTTTFENNYALSEVPDVKSILEAAISQLRDNQIF